MEWNLITLSRNKWRKGITSNELVKLVLNFLGEKRGKFNLSLNNYGTCIIRLVFKSIIYHLKTVRLSEGYYTETFLNYWNFPVPTNQVTAFVFWLFVIFNMFFHNAVMSPQIRETLHPLLRTNRSHWFQKKHLILVAIQQFK